MNFLQTSEIKDPRISKFRLKATPSKVQRISSELQIVNATTNSMFPIDEKIINDYNISQKNNKTDLNPEDINMDYNKNDYNPAKIEELEEETPRQNQNPDLVPISRNESKASLYENEQNLEDSNNESEISEKNIVIQKENLEIASTNNVFCNKNLNFIAENTIKDFENVRLNEPSHKESPEINLEITLPEKSTHFANEKNLHQTLESEQKLSKDIEETINETNIRGKEQEKQLLEFDFKSIKCPKHVKEEIIFICNAPDCQKKFLCSKCLVDDMKDQTRHHIIHEAYLIPYDEHIFKHEYEKFLTKKSNFDKILNDQDYLLLEQIENGEVNSIIQKKYQNEVLEIEGFIENVNLRSNDVLSEYKNKIKENVAQDIQFFLRDIMNNFISMKDEFKDKTQKMKEIQIKSNEIFGKDEIEGSYEKIDFFLNLHQENLEDHTFQNFSTFLQASLKSLKEYTAKESNKALKYEFYINLMNALKIMINEKIPKNLLNPNFSLLLKTNVNISKEEWLKDKKPELFEQKNAEKEMIANKIHKTDKINQIILQDLKEAQQVFSVEKSRNNIIFTDYDKINSKYFYDLEYSLVLDICLLGPTEKNEYYVATCCSRERYIKIWLLPKDRPPSEYKSLEGHNKSTYKLFYCHEKKWLLSAGFEIYFNISIFRLILNFMNIFYVYL